MSRLLFTQTALSDLLEAWMYIAEDNPAAADRALEAIKPKNRS